MNLMRFHKSTLVLVLVMTIAIDILLMQTGPVLVNAQNVSGSITSYRVSGAPNYALPGTEPFWDTISWTQVPLAASVSPGGGHTPNVLVKSANDGYNIYVLFRWNDSVGPSFGFSSEMYASPNGTLLPLNPADTAQAKQLFYNSTYYYPDRVAMLWFLENASERQQSPAMQLGSDGAITGGAAEIWHWQTNPTDNSPNDTGFPGGYTDPSGAAVYPPDNMSFAEDDYTNTTGFYVIAGSFGASAPNLAPYSDPYIVHVGNYFSDSNKTWTVEMVRSFTTDTSAYREQLTTNSTYYVAFAVWNGLLGESSHIKSVSQWYTLTNTNQAPPQAPVPPVPSQGGVNISTATAVGIGLLIVGVIIGVIVRPRPKESQR